MPIPTIEIMHSIFRIINMFGEGEKNTVYSDREYEVIFSKNWRSDCESIKNLLF
jgi:hypothetical protein